MLLLLSNLRIKVVHDKFIAIRGAGVTHNMPEQMHHIRVTMEQSQPPIISHDHLIKAQPIGRPGRYEKGLNYGAVSQIYHILNFVKFCDLLLVILEKLMEPPLGVSITPADKSQPKCHS